MIKTFRNKVDTGTIETIRLSTNQGLIGYRIVKLQTLTQNPFTVTSDLVCKVYTIKPDAATATVDLDDPTLIGVALWSSNTSSSDDQLEHMHIILDHVVVNQDIFITIKQATGSDPANYYLELEQVKLDLSEATVATLKDMRGTN